MKIFVIGFQRSGTTMLRRILHNHPDVSLLHEQKTIKRGKTKEAMLQNVYRRFPKLKNKQHWGDKMPWYDKHGNTIIGYSKKWADFFEDEARILHIIRHPIDVAKSTVKLKWARNHDTPIIFHSGSVPKVIEYIDSDPRFINLTFEDLVMNKEDMIVRLCEFCKVGMNKTILKQILEGDYRYFDGINGDRAFAYKREGKPKLKYPVPDYDKLLEKAKRRL